MIDLECISLSDGMSVNIPSASVICLGNFDGVHLAHRALFHRAIALQKSTFPSAKVSAFCFREPSWVTLSGNDAIRLSTLEEKIALFRSIGCEYLFLCDFASVRNLSPEQFAVDILKNHCHCVAAVCGFNYRFGKHGKGDASLLGSLLDSPVDVQEEILFEGNTVSSTYIRKLLSQGDVKTANTLLCEPYSITAEVVQGKALGRTIGFPTLNQRLPSYKMAPRNGVYLTSCEIDGVRYGAITNIGVHPTVDSQAQKNCETHLFDTEINAYGKTATVRFLAFLRPEQKFDSLELLCQQMQADLSLAKNLFRKGSY
ncbi:MAG: riboflavin biosynthesis protein RibF [Ruminococcaceae bacterium]|nr:riboflavin biosynthesis protein RibF [Oscillospiraceae bacterium]